ncbi:response regulator transcription factor [Pseudoalteromonas luteoviolacea]|uniref:response regulator transcription factor n=1 Tax=Pseudoalteromonas luteoviolacea TaxID=43657 RepID=UPI001B396CED|nr:response regulator transcription factor [Pseudoalteromonas luteoviolacea]MBQ4811618.1 response regulator transcription factor [Pseudoalteromonas luteoviolacea]
MLVLLVEDDAALAAQLIDFLQHENIEVDYAASIRSAKEIAAQTIRYSRYDAVILDMDLPDGNGISLVGEQMLGQGVPVLFCTAATALEDKLAAFSAGALDYITKPFDLPELAVRLKILAKKQETRFEHVFELDTLSVDFNSKIAKRGERILVLSPQQWVLLGLLTKNAPNPLSKEEILCNVWPDQDVNNNMYKSLLTRLRKNISKDGELELLHTIKGQGLMLRKHSE